MDSRTYKEKLLDPRWQKKRLEILQRDDWACQRCFDTENTLHIHHRLYKKGLDPWEYEDNWLVTLCADCHQSETDCKHEAMDTLISALKLYYGAFEDEIHGLGCDFAHGPLAHNKEVVFSTIGYFLRNHSFQQEMTDKYFEILKEKRNEAP